MALLQRDSFSFFYSIFNQILTSEDDVRAGRHFLLLLDFNALVKYLFDFEVTFFAKSQIGPQENMSF